MKLSITMMVKNEEKNLERCLKSLQPLRDSLETELIIVDTGSTDTTVEIAKQYTDEIYFHEWGNDFSAMRNISISYAKGEWIFIIDADEELVVYQDILDFFKSSPNKKLGAVAMECRNIGNSLDPAIFSLTVGFRIFKNDGYFHYDGAVHNQPVFKGEHIALPKASLLHYGYISNDTELMEKKFLRTSAILKSELEKDQENIYYWSQLAVTYGMHNDYEQAIECIEKAYALTNGEKSRNYMHVYTHMALMYELVGKYERVEKICLEALDVSQEYIDIYYFLAEAQAVLKKPYEAICNYKKYLELLKRHKENEIRDVTIIEYTLGYSEVVFFNLSNLYKNTGDYETAFQYAKQVTSKEAIRDNLPPLIYLYLKLDKYKELCAFYNENIEVEWQSVFFEKLDLVIKDYAGDFCRDVRLNIAKVFIGVEHFYGLLSAVIVDDAAGRISEKTKERMQNLDLENLPVYCSEILYYLLKYKISLNFVIGQFKEIWLSCAFEYVIKKHTDLSELIYAYMEQYTQKNLLYEYKLSKALCRIALLQNNLDNGKYRTLFKQYIQEGITYLLSVYSEQVIQDILLYEVKNDEEVFMLYMYHAQMSKEDNQVEYVKYLRQALQAFPAMKRGVEILLQNMQDTKNNEKNNEFELYKQEIKNLIQQLIDKGNMSEAKTILNEYKSIVPYDLESVLLESKILLN